MKKPLALLLIVLLAVSGCTPSKSTRDGILTEKSVMITIYPDGSEYRSEDNGISWSCDGEDVGFPDAYMTMRTLDPLTFEERHLVTLHNNNYFERMQICRTYDVHIEMLSDGEWIYANMAEDDTVLLTDGHEIFDEEAVDLWLFLPVYEHKSGRYRARIPYEGYTFIAEFSVIA